MAWLQNKNVQFALGLAVLVLAIKLMFFSDSIFALSASIVEDSNGAPKTESTTGIATLSVVFDVFYAVMVFIGAKLINVGSMIVGKFVQSQSIVPAADATAAPANIETLKNSLAQAVAVNDPAQIAKIAWVIRKEYAMAELQEALSKGDFTSAQLLFTELTTPRV